jgi:hypothetical protein
VKTVARAFRSKGDACREHSRGMGKQGSPGSSGTHSMLSTVSVLSAMAALSSCSPRVDIAKDRAAVEQGSGGSVGSGGATAPGEEEDGSGGATSPGTGGAVSEGSGGAGNDVTGSGGIAPGGGESGGAASGGARSSSAGAAGQGPPPGADAPDHGIIVADGGVVGTQEFTCPSSCTVTELRAHGKGLTDPYVVTPGTEALTCFAYHVATDGSSMNVRVLTLMLENTLVTHHAEVLRWPGVVPTESPFPCPQTGDILARWIPGGEGTFVFPGAGAPLGAGDVVLAMHYVNTSNSVQGDRGGFKMCACPP